MCLYAPLCLSNAGVCHFQLAECKTKAGGEAFVADWGGHGNAYDFFRANDHRGNQDFADGPFKRNMTIFIRIIADGALDVRDNRIGVAHIPEREDGCLHLLEALGVPGQEKFIVPVVIVVKIHNYNIP